MAGPRSFVTASMLALAHMASAPSIASDTSRPVATRHSTWQIYGGGHDNIKYSRLSQINRDNVRNLQVAWTYDSGDAFGEGANSSEMECNPIIVDGVLYAVTPKMRVIALDAASGALRWAFDPNEGQPVAAKPHRSRGVTYWADGNDRRIVVGVHNYLYALNADDGRLVASFGAGGKLDLHEGLGRDPRTQSVVVSSPAVAYKDLLIIGGVVSENLPASPGYIRAFDARTGKLRWIFHTIPHPGEFGHETWPKDAWQRSGGANNWSGMSLDERRGIVFVPTGSASYDFYGADRLGDNLFANTLLALDAATGKRLWHFQTVHHDVWDRDLPTPPSLITVRREGRPIDAVAQITKSGFVMVFDRQTGEPLFPIKERPVPFSDVPGEVTAKTQPFPLHPAPFARQVLSEDMLTKRTPEAHAAVLTQLRRLRSGGQFVPPSLQGTIIFPGFDGGAEWGGATFDPETHLLYVNANEMAWILQVLPRPTATEQTTGGSIFQAECATCHGNDRRGNPPQFPALIDIGKRRSREEVQSIIANGSGRMPAFSRLGNESIAALAEYLLNDRDIRVSSAAGASDSSNPSEYLLQGYRKFLDPDGYPAVEPPWGTLNAINMDTGEYVWRIPLGEYPELAANGMTNTGSENYGGSVVTAGGLLFIGATLYDNKFRAFDKSSGKLLWETTLPAAGNATPAVYEAHGRQFVVIAAGGGKNIKGKPGGAYVSFALPRTAPAKPRQSANRE